MAKNSYSILKILQLRLYSPLGIHRFCYYMFQTFLSFYLFWCDHYLAERRIIDTRLVRNNTVSASFLVQRKYLWKLTFLFYVIIVLNIVYVLPLWVWFVTTFTFASYIKLRQLLLNLKNIPESAMGSLLFSFTLFSLSYGRIFNRNLRISSFQGIILFEALAID